MPGDWTAPPATRISTPCAAGRLSTSPWDYYQGSGGWTYPLKPEMVDA